MPQPAGHRNTRVTVQRLRQSSATDESGHIDESNANNWEPATDVGSGGKLWVGLVTRGSKEFFRGQQVAADITHQVEALYSSAKNIRTKMRMTFKGRVLNVAEPPRNIDEGNHTLQFACIEVIEGR